MLVSSGLYNFARTHRHTKEALCNALCVRCFYFNHLFFLLFPFSLPFSLFFSSVFLLYFSFYLIFVLVVFFFLLFHSFLIRCIRFFLYIFLRLSLLIAFSVSFRLTFLPLPSFPRLFFPCIFNFFLCPRAIYFSLCHSTFILFLYPAHISTLTCILFHSFIYFLRTPFQRFLFQPLTLLINRKKG